jgi:hypothetical protein
VPYPALPAPSTAPAVNPLDGVMSYSTPPCQICRFELVPNATFNTAALSVQGNAVRQTPASFEAVRLSHPPTACG